MAPGIVDTDVNAGCCAATRRPRRTPRRCTRWAGSGGPRTIADVVAFLASDDARWVTGRVIDATGGAGL
jgi:NAD(P)-dependent dehydrogenase (short-subunit alcohol dehydrogenase family)